MGDYQVKFWSPIFFDWDAYLMCVGAKTSVWVGFIWVVCFLIKEKVNWTAYESPTKSNGEKGELG
jgi:hypothetical protein